MCFMWGNREICALRVPRLQTRYSTVIIIIILIGLISILKLLIWWGVLGACQYVQISNAAKQNGVARGKKRKQ